MSYHREEVSSGPGRKVHNWQLTNSRWAGLGRGIRAIRRIDLFTEDIIGKKWN
jgi:hypothetical protein